METKNIKEKKEDQITQNPDSITVNKKDFETLSNWYNLFQKEPINTILLKNPDLYINHLIHEYKKLTDPNIMQRLNNAQADLTVILKKEPTRFQTKGYTIDTLFTDLQPALNKYGIILQYTIEYLSEEKILYYPSKEKDGIWGFRRNPTIITVTKSDKELDGNTWKDKNQTIEKKETIQNELLGKTILMFRFKGQWININNKSDYLDIQFPIPCELKDSSDAGQSLAAAATLAFRTNLCRQFQIPTIEDDADFDSASEAAKEKLKSNIKDNDWSKLYKAIKTIDPKNKYVLEKENEFQTKIKPLYNDCDSYYDFLLRKFITATAADAGQRPKLRSKLQEIYNEVHTKATGGN